MKFLVLLCVVIILVILYLLCLKPNRSRTGSMKPFEEVYFAHRGLFDQKLAPENSLEAFRRAVEGGYGIELDVQLTSDGQLVVFHDESLKRMCGVARKLWKCSYREICQYHLLDSGEQIPLFKDVLEIVNGKIPMIIEIKTAGDGIKTAKALSEYLENYTGIYCIESFDPQILHWYRKHYPKVIRGQLSTNYWLNESKQPIFVKIGMTNLLTNFYAKPDFIAYNYKYEHQLSLQLCHRLYHTELAAWTIRSPEALEQARKSFRIFIFDGFVPAGKLEKPVQKS